MFPEKFPHWNISGQKVSFSSHGNSPWDFAICCPLPLAKPLKQQRKKNRSCTKIAEFSDAVKGVSLRSRKVLRRSRRGDVGGKHTRVVLPDRTLGHHLEMHDMHSDWSISKWLRKGEGGIMKRDCGSRKEIEGGRCPTCQKQFMPVRGWQRFCSSVCRDGWHNQERRKALALYRAQWAPKARFYWAASVTSSSRTPIHVSVILPNIPVGLVKQFLVGV